MTDSRCHRPRVLSQALLLAMLSPFPALAQQADPQQLDAVTVTGSRIKRVQAEGPAPVQIIGSEEIRAQGFTTVYDMLGTLNQAIGTVEADVSWGSHTPNASPLNLRNLGPNRSLLLVNGRRVADYPLPITGRATSPTTATSLPRRWTGWKCSPVVPRPSTARTRSPAWST